MRTPAAAAVLLVACLLLAGCSATTDTGPGTDPAPPASATAPATTTSATTAPPGDAASSTTAGATASDDGLPPGVSASGVENVTALKRAHVRSVRSGGYRECSTLTANYVETPEVDPGRIVLAYALDADGEHDRSRLVQTGPATASRYLSTWGNGTARYGNRTVVNYQGPTTVFTRTAIDGPRGLATLPESVVDAGDYAVVSRDDDRIVLRATTPSANASERRSIESYRGRLVLAPDGRILDANATMTVNRSGRTVRQTLDFELRATDGVSVERPGWVDSARGNAYAFDAELVDGRYVKLTNVGAKALDADASIALTTGGSGSFATLSEPLEPGEHVYVYRTQDGSVERSRTKPTAEATPVSTAWTVTVGSGALYVEVPVRDEKSG